MNLTPKQEAFCLAYIETGNASEAYRRAYDASNMKPESINRKAKELIDNGKIAARVAGLQEVAAERAIVSVLSLTEELEEARALALQEGQASAAVSASMGKAKLHGLLTDKVEHKGGVTVTMGNHDADL
jgi:phage terminase small subunit